MATAVAATDPLREFFGELRSRIIHDFRLERWSAHDRDVGLQKLKEIVFQMILIESVDHLTESNAPSAEVLKNSSDLICQTVYLDRGRQSRDHLASTRR
jgi:hypothetical protein